MDARGDLDGSGLAELVKDLGVVELLVLGQRADRLARSSSRASGRV